MKRRLSLGAVVLLLAASCGTGAVPGPTPSTTAPPSTSSLPTAAPSPTGQPIPGTVYFARDRLPPVGLLVTGAGDGASPEARVLGRLNVLFAAPPPPHLFNTTLISKARPKSVAIALDVATVDFAVPDEGWGTAGSAGTRAFVQQVVYTASEEPGIRRVLITENGHQAIIGGEGVVIDHPVSREDVSGYATRASLDPMIVGGGPAVPPRLTSSYSVDEVSPGLVRFVVDTGLYGADAKGGVGFTLTPRINDDLLDPELGKWAFSVFVPSARGGVGSKVVGTTPLRTIRSSAEGTGIRYDLGLDDLRPWRAALLYEPLRLVVDIGGDPDAVTANIAVYSPRFGDGVGPAFTASGLIRAFEAQYQYRVVGYDGAVLVDGFARASLGTSELWGEFSVAVAQVPPTGGVLQILLRSPMDGSVSEVVSVPIRR